MSSSRTIRVMLPPNQSAGRRASWATEGGAPARALPFGGAAGASRRGM